MSKLEKLTSLLGTMRDLESIVRTMKTLAAVTIKQLEARQIGLEDMIRVNALGLFAVLQDAAIAPDLMLSDQPRKAHIIVGSERGFCGNFNDNIAHKFVAETAKDIQPNGPTEILAIGSRLTDTLEEHPIAITHRLALPASPDGLDETLQTVLRQTDAWLGSGITDVQLTFTKRTSLGQLALITQTIWPIDPQSLEQLRAATWPLARLPVVQGDPVELLQTILWQVLKTNLLCGLMDSMISENAARLSSLQAAEKNISEKQKALTKAHNTERQQAITAEILEITAGFNLTEPKASRPI